MNQKIISLIFFGILFFSCNNHSDRKRVKIKDLSIGDKIDENDFIFRNHMDSAILVSKSKSDIRLSILTWFDVIVGITYSPLTKNEFDSLKNVFNTILDTKPEIRKGITKSGIKILGYEYLWYDSITGDEITMGYYKVNPDSLNAGLMISNDRFTKKIIPENKDTLIIEEYNE